MIVNVMLLVLPGILGLLFIFWGLVIAFRSGPSPSRKVSTY